MIALASALPNKTIAQLAVISALFLFTPLTFAGVQTTVAVQTEEPPSFSFTNVPPPSRNDAATAADFTVISGKADANGGRLEKLHDGKVPNEADEAAENFFFSAGTEGGRIQIDLLRALDLKQINTYSCHPSTRGPQVYKLYASDGKEKEFIAKPTKQDDLIKSGWKLIAEVDTRPKETQGEAQYGVSISDPAGSIGTYRYLLFDISRTEAEDPFGNTFYSEIDVVELNAPAPLGVVTTPSFHVQSADGYCNILLDTSNAPELKDWAEQTLAPVLSEWYPKIVGMMSSEGFKAPKKFSISIRPGSGVAATSGTRITANSAWLSSELKREAIGALIHEVVHVVQQYNRRNGGRPAPNWLIEGIPDYIRFFKFEPQTHGADQAWLQRNPSLALNYDGLYRTSANFLDYVVERYDPDRTLIQKINAACRGGSYTDTLWNELTGKPLSELNDEWKAAARKQPKSN